MDTVTLITCPHCSGEYVEASFIITGPSQLQCRCGHQFERNLASTRELRTPDNKKPN